MAELSNRLTQYSARTGSEQSATREDVFRRLEAMQLELANIHSRGLRIAAELQEFAAFVTANGADFTAPQRTDLGTIRNAFRSAVNSYSSDPSWP